MTLALELHKKTVHALSQTGQMSRSELLGVFEEEVGVDQELLDLMSKHSKVEGTSISKSSNSAFGPELLDLALLWRAFISILPLTTVEFGSGYSTKILSKAALVCRNRFGNLPFNIERHSSQPFSVFSLDESRKWQKIARERLTPEEEECAYFSVHRVKRDRRERGAITTYGSLPDVKPDLLFLDGPSQFANRAKINGLSAYGKNKFPISSDALFYEWSMEPGATIVVDGRKQNVEFLQGSLQRDWEIQELENCDFTVMTLVSGELGLQNKLKLEWQLEN